MLRRDIRLLADIGLLVVQRDRCVGTAGSNPFPTGLIQGGLFETTFVKFPVQELVPGLLCSGLAEQGWQVTAIDFSAAGVAKGRERAAAQGLQVDWVADDVVTADLGSGYDLVALLYLQLPHAQMATVMGHCVDALAPGGRLVVIAHDIDNLTRGVGGPQDASVLPSVSLLRDWAGAAQVERAEQVERETPDGTAIDVLVVARR